MARYVALLRGVNVGKHNRVAMARLRELLEGLGYQEVRTLLQSGNAVFSAPGRPTAQLASEIQQRLASELGLTVDVTVRTAPELRAVVAANPLDVGDPARFLVVFLPRAPEPEQLARVTAEARPSEEMRVGERELYLWCPQGIREARLPLAVQRHLGGTARNWTTTAKLADLAES
ncbi:uncharacterized protein (DUF1697 family) [Lipingzhangella halophila]|uniref:Uncharacterized protein (DUF1697 family) n=1 Tax=Lipingzhangella halophila TaxID=1783352 RepID=A0A7W7W3I8_9ACTN|nr:DUF1697 domain-containing protein [Lipingzhangella halophila]MBB4931770.1 uncharacterized protein (DUF1697 family) [Lipingzhangella halophila]